MARKLNKVEDRNQIKKSRAKASHPSVKSTHQMTVAVSDEHKQGLVGELVVGDQTLKMLMDSGNDGVVLKSDLVTGANSFKYDIDSSTFVDKTREYRSGKFWFNGFGSNSKFGTENIGFEAGNQMS